MKKLSIPERSKQIRIKKVKGRNDWQATNIGNGHQYLVKFTDGAFSCTCPDHWERQRECKHIIRVKIRGKINA